MFSGHFWTNVAAKSSRTARLAGSAIGKFGQIWSKYIGFVISVSLSEMVSTASPNHQSNKALFAMPNWLGFDHYHKR